MSFFVSTALAQNNPPPPGGGGATTTAQAQSDAPAGVPTGDKPGLGGMLIPLVLMFGVFYFLMIRPQQKKMKDHQALIEKIKYGDEVVTNAGIFGKVTGITDKVLTIEIADNVKIKMLKSQIASVNPKID